MKQHPHQYWMHRIDASINHRDRHPGTHSKCRVGLIIADELLGRLFHIAMPYGSAVIGDWILSVR